MRFLPRLAAAFVLLALLAVSPRQARPADARTVHKQVGVHAGLCVLLGDNPAERALALAKVSDLVIYVPTGTHAEATTIRAAVEKAGLLGTRIYVDHGRSQRIGLASNLADAVVVEDALSGVAAGHAGSFGLVLGVDRGVGVEALQIAGADVVVKDLKETIAR